MAVILLLCALACMLFPIYSGVVISTLTGALMFICGMYSVAMALIFIKYNTRSYISSLLFGIIYFGVGCGFIFSTSFGINTLSLLFCVLFILAGYSRIAMGFKDRAMKGRYWCIFIGIIDLIIALAWLRASEDANYIITVTFIGLEMLFCAGFFLVLSYALNKAQKKLITT
ncbi:TPA: DUF308 domain-containing protein [Klebsiella pneumoniae]